MTVRQGIWPITTAAIMAAVCVTSGCARSQPPEPQPTVRQTPRRAWDMVADARSRIENLTVEATAAAQAAGAIIVDLRETEERLTHGAIPGAIHAPRGMLEFWADPSSPVHRSEFDPARRYVLHCAVGGRSALAAVTLQELGYTDVAHLDGGFAAWKAAERPVETVEGPTRDLVRATGVRGDR